MAIAYNDLGLDRIEAIYEAYAATECGKMESALRAFAVENEPNPAKVNWNC
jgi:L-2-hydroxyglutarate oxidase LhgO